MASFPTLKTGAVAQYPVSRGMRFSNQIQRFVDGGEQRYRDSSSPLRRWVIRLDQLDECELASLEAFFLSNQGAYGSFAFTDPRDGTPYPDCSLEADGFSIELLDEMRGRTTLTVRENRS